MLVACVLVACVLVGCGEGTVIDFDGSAGPEPCEPSNARNACVGSAPSTLHPLPNGVGLGVLTATAGMAIIAWDAGRTATPFTGPTGYDTPNPDDTLLGCKVQGAQNSVFLGSRQLATKARIWDLAGPGEWAAGPDTSAAVLGSRCGDIDGDGLDELFGLWPPDDQLRAYRGSDRFSSRWETSVDLSEAGVPPYPSMLVDLDGDDAAEFVFSSVDEPTIHILSDLAEGATVRSARWSPGAVRVGAISAMEGSPGLVWVGTNTDGTGVLGAYELDADFEPVSDESFQTVAAPNRLFVADLDRDDVGDAVVASMPGSEYFVHLGLDTGGFSPPTRVDLASPTIDLALGDFDGDGLQDLASLPAGADQVVIVWGDVTGRPPGGS